MKTKRMKTWEATITSSVKTKTIETRLATCQIACLLIHILSFLNVKDAVCTCVLSSRWEHLWKHLTVLTLHRSDFGSVKGFMQFVTGILSLRNNSTPLNALDFECQACVGVQPHVIEKIYTASHNVCCLRLSYYGGFSPSFLLSCHSLTSLDIGSQNDFNLKKFPNSLNLPALTYLKLHHFFFYTGSNGRVEPFSTFNRLDTLILYCCCNVQDKQQPLRISSTTLLNLSIHGDYIFMSDFSNIELFAPRLCVFALNRYSIPKVFGSHLSSIEQVSIDVLQVHDKSNFDPLDLLKFLIELANIKSLTIAPKTLQVLSLIHDISKLKFTSLGNLKSLNVKLDSYIFPAVTRDIKLELANGKSWKENVKLREKIKAGLEPIYSSILDRMIEFLLQNSPSAKVDILFES